MQEFCMVGGYTEDLEKPQNCQNRGVGTCSRMGVCPGQYGIRFSVLINTITGGCEHGVTKNCYLAAQLETCTGSPSFTADGWRGEPTLALCEAARKQAVWNAFNSKCLLVLYWAWH